MQKGLAFIPESLSSEENSKVPDSWKIKSNQEVKKAKREFDAKQDAKYHR